MGDLGHNGGPNLDDVDDATYPGRDGYIRLARSIRYHHIVGFGLNGEPYRPSEAFIDLVMECRYRDGKVTNGGTVMTLRPGQMLGAVSWLASRWKWSPKQVRLFLDKLSADGTISLGYGADQNGNVSDTADNEGTQHGKHKGKQARVITICNYALYQVLQGQEGQTPGHVLGQTKGNQGANKGQHIRKGKRERREEEESPYSPPAGDAPPDDFQLAGDSAAPRAERDKAARAEVEEAIRVFNLAAEHFKFTKYLTRDASRDRRIARRLKDIGGLGAFKDGLRALGVSTPLSEFLLGRVPPRAGEKTAFRLDLDSLLQTDGRLGNVLSRLVDQAAAAGPLGPRWAEWDRATWRTEIEQHANGVWPPDKIGFWPGHPKCAVPPDLVAEMGLDQMYDENGIKRGGRHA